MFLRSNPKSWRKRDFIRCLGVVSHTQAHKTLIRTGMIRTQSAGRNATVLPKDELGAHVNISYTLRPDNRRYP